MLVTIPYEMASISTDVEIIRFDAYIVRVGNVGAPILNVNGHYSFRLRVLFSAEVCSEPGFKPTS